jgi:hypothetical protein
MLLRFSGGLAHLLSANLVVLLRIRIPRAEIRIFVVPRAAAVSPQGDFLFFHTFPQVFASKDIRIIYYYMGNIQVFIKYIALEVFVSQFRTQAPWEFLLSASRTTLQSYELSRLAHTANLRKEIGELLGQYMEESTSAMLARLGNRRRC